MTVRGLPATRVAAQVTPDAPIALRGPVRRFVSRGGEKLEGALARLEVVVEGRTWMDAGASTGGFTDCLLKRGAAEVVAIDVGYGQLDWSIRNDERVTVMERTNVRNLTPEDLSQSPDGVVADLSFISLTTVLPAIAGVAANDADFVLLVKPQFEAGREAVGRGGVVKDPATWKSSIERVVAAGDDLGLGLMDTVPSEPPGPAGNREFFVHLRAGAESDGGSIEPAIAEVAG